MRERWGEVRADLLFRIQSQKTIRLFAEIARQHGALATFREPVALAESLQSLRQDPAGNALYLHIVDVWRLGPEWRSDVANQILWLGLWPLLNWIYMRQIWFWRGREGDLTSEIGRCLATVLRGTNFMRVTSVALTIIRDTERDVVEARQASLADEANDLEIALIPWQEPRSFGNGDAPPALEQMADHLKRLLGADFELAVAAYETGCDYDNLGKRFGLEHAEIRRRLRRAWRRVRKQQTNNRIE